MKTFLQGSECQNGVKIYFSRRQQSKAGHQENIGVSWNLCESPGVAKPVSGPEPCIAAPERTEMAVDWCTISNLASLPRRERKTSTGKVTQISRINPRKHRQWCYQKCINQTLSEWSLYFSKWDLYHSHLFKLACKSLQKQVLLCHCWINLLD